MTISQGHENRQRARVWAAYDAAWHDYLDWVRLAGDFGCDIPVNPPVRPSFPRPQRRGAHESQG